MKYKIGAIARLNDNVKGREIDGGELMRLKYVKGWQYFFEREDGNCWDAEPFSLGQFSWI